MGKALKLLRFLRRSSVGNRFSGATLGVALLSGTAAGLASAALIAVIDAALSARASELPRLLGLFVALCAALPMLRLLSSFLLARFSQAARCELEVQLSRRILAAPLVRLEKIGAPHLLAALTEDVGSIVTALSNLPVILRLGAVLAGGVIYLAFLSWHLLTIVLVLLALGVGVYRMLVRMGQSSFTRSREMSDRIFRSFRGLTDGIKELKIHHRRRQVFIERQIADPARERARHQVSAQAIFAVAGGWGQLLSFLAIGVILFGLSGVGTATRTGFVLTVLYMLNALDTLLGQIPSLHRADVSIRHIQKLDLWLEEQTDAPEDRGVVEAPVWSWLELRGVTHDYAGEPGTSTFTLGPLDLTIRRGESLFLVGGNGSGKTTLAKLLMGLYTPQAGTVLLDGEPVGDANRERLRSLFSAVFSDFFLFDSLLGLEKDDLAVEAARYLRDLELAHKVSIEGGVLSTLDLSQGQRKRLALLTAYLEDRSIYLFDEWAADQDPKFKDVFYRQLVPNLLERGKTVIVITHDDRYYDTAEHIAKLDSGKIVLDNRAPATLRL
jgi:putative ATP-binding cassette transporter